MEDPMTVFMNDVVLETAVYVHEIANEDTTLTVDIYTRNPHNARQALMDLRVAIDELLEEWDTGKYSKVRMACFYHSGGKWPLHILRPSAA